MKKRVLSLMLALALVLSLVPVTAFAANETKKYVSLGDSMSNGLGLLDGYNTTGSKGYNEIAKSGYPNLVATHFGWELTQLSTSRMRIDDLRFVLEYGTENAYADDGWISTHFSEKNGMWNSEAAGGLEKVAANFQKSVREADVISMCLGNGNFAVYMADMLKDIFGLGVYGMDYSYATVENGIKNLDEEAKALVTEISKEIIAYLSMALPEELAQKMADRVIYTLARYLENYNAVLDLIAEMNPDVELIIVGLMNALSGYKMDLVYGGETYHLDMAQVLDLAFVPLNTYLAALPTLKQAQGKCTEVTFYYAQIERIKTLGTSFQETFMEDPEFFRSRFAEDISSNILPRLNMDLVAVTYEDVLEYEKAYALGTSALAGYVALRGSQKAKSVAVYLALENALLNALDIVPYLNVDEITAETNGNSGMMSYVGALIEGVSDLYEKNTQEAIEKCFAEDIFLKGLYLADPDSAKQLAHLYVASESLEKALGADKTIASVLNLYGQMSLANGMNVHPNKESHAELAERIIASYESGNTVQQEMLNRAQQAMAELLQVWGELHSQRLKDDYQQMIVDGGLRGMAEDLIQALDLTGSESAGTIAGTAQEMTNTIESIVGTYQAATNKEYRVNATSYYVALGDSSAAGSSYVKKLAKDLGLGSKSYKNLAKSKAVIEDTFGTVAKNQETVAKADLITLGYTSNNFINEAIDQAMDVFSGEEPEALDWVSLIGEEYAQMLQEAFTSLTSELVAMVPDETLAPVVTAAVEGYAYSCVSYIVNIPKLVEAIRKINPDAVLVVLGMYNPLENISISLGETQLELGNYLDYLTAVTGAYTLMYAIRSGEAIYVDAAQVQTVYESEDGVAQIAMMDLAMQYVRLWGEDFLPSEDGHAYIAEQIQNAMGHRWQAATCTAPATCLDCGETKGEALGHIWKDATEATPKTCLFCGATEGDPLKHTHTFTDGKCTVCGAVDENYKPEEKVLYGDANGDGAVNAKDAMLVLQYYTKKITEDKLDLTACDVDGNGVVNAKDAMLILQKYTKKITNFPVEAA